jgi:hypothetical protein
MQTKRAYTCDILHVTEQKVIQLNTFTTQSLFYNIAASLSRAVDALSIVYENLVHFILGHCQLAECPQDELIPALCQRRRTIGKRRRRSKDDSLESEGFQDRDN